MNSDYSIMALKPGQIAFADTLEAAREKARDMTYAAVIHDANDDAKLLYYEGQVYEMVAVDVEAEVTK